MQQLLQLMQHLRQECPWDKQQTPQSLTPYAIEEAYEVEQAIRSGNLAEIKEELGDLLLQVIFQSQMYSEQQAFTFDDVVQTLKEKLIRRHPHIFQKEHYAHLDEQGVKQLWQHIKQQERQAKGQTAQPSILDSVKHGSALMQAEQIQVVASKVGFDFPNFDATYAKLEEELAELNQAIAQQHQDDIAKEYGDCLFALVNMGRTLNLNSELCLLGTIDKFRYRFAYIEQQAQAQGKKIDDLTLEEMDKLWEDVKKLQYE